MKKYIRNFQALLLVIILLFSTTVVLAESKEKQDVLITSITLSETEMTVPVKGTAKITAKIEPSKAKNKKLEWSSTDETVATVKNGQIRGIGNGTCNIICKATDESGMEASCKVTVITPIKTIKLSQGAKMDLPLDTTMKLEAVITPEDATTKVLKWESSNEKIVSVDEEGNIIGKKTGTAKITACSTDGTNRKAVVSVKVEKYDIIFFDSKPQTVKYEFGSGLYTIKCKAKKGCIKVTGIDNGSRLVLIGDKRESDTCTVTPLKPGADMIVITAGSVTNWIRVFVSQDAFREEEEEEEEALDRGYLKQVVKETPEPKNDK